MAGTIRVTRGTERDTGTLRNEMKIGLQISSFTWPGGTPAIAQTLAEIARQADDVGFDSIWVMDHFFQIRSVGKT